MQAKPDSQPLNGRQMTSIIGNHHQKYSTKFHQSSMCVRWTYSIMRYLLNYIRIQAKPDSQPLNDKQMTSIIGNNHQKYSTKFHQSSMCVRWTYYWMRNELHAIRMKAKPNSQLLNGQLLTSIIDNHQQPWSKLTLISLLYRMWAREVATGENLLVHIQALTQRSKQCRGSSKGWTI